MFSVSFCLSVCLSMHFSLLSLPSLSLPHSLMTSAGWEVLLTRAALTGFASVAQARYRWDTILESLRLERIKRADTLQLVTDVCVANGIALE